MTPLQRAARATAVVGALVVCVWISAGRGWALSVLAVAVVLACGRAAAAWRDLRRARAVVELIEQGPRDVPDAMRDVIFERDGGRCRYCGRPVHYRSRIHDPADELDGCGIDFEADHVVAYSRGGPTALENLVTACRDGNRRKLDHPVEAFLRCGGCLGTGPVR